MRWAVIFSLVSALCFAPPALAQTSDAAVSVPDPAIAELAQQYIRIGGAEDMFVEGAAYGFRRGAAANGLEFTPRQWERVRVAVHAAFEPASTIFARDLGDYYAANSSREDLSAALAFYNSPQGNRFVAATVAYSFPLSAYLAAPGHVPLEDAPPAAELDAGRLALARELAASLNDNLHPSERAALDMTPLRAEGILDYIARSLAAVLDDEALAAAIAWNASEPSRRLEGASAERTLTIQTAMLRAMQVVDMETLRQALVAIMSETPT